MYERQILDRIERVIELAKDTAGDHPRRDEVVSEAREALSALADFFADSAHPKSEDE